MTNDESTIKHIKEYTQSVRDFVEQKTRELEQRIKDGSMSNIDRYMNFLISKTCSVYNLCEADLQRQRCSSLAVEAQDIIIIIMKAHSQYYSREILAFFNKKNRDRVEVAKRNHREKDPKIKHHKEYLDNFKIIEDSFLEWKNTKT